MRLSLKISDPKGFVIKTLIITIIWYASLIQYFREISNFLLFIGVVLSFAVFYDYTNGGRNRIHGSFPTPVLLILVYIVLTFLLGIVASTSLSTHINRGITSIEYALVMFFITYYCVTRKNVDVFFWNHIILYLFVSVLLIRSPVIYSDYRSEGIRYSFANGANPNGVAMGINTAIWCLLYFIQIKKVKPILGFVCVALMAYATIQTGSRKALIALVGCLVLWTLICYLPLNIDKRISSVLFKTVGVIAIVIVAFRYFLPIVLNSTTYVRMMQLITHSDMSTTNRIGMYSQGLEMAVQSPILGWGFDAYRMKYGAYAHSDIVETLVSSGFLLSILYYMAYFKILLDSGKTIRKVKHLSPKFKDEIRIIILQGIVLFTVHLFYSLSVVHIQSLASYINVSFICCLGYLAKYFYVSSSEAV